MHFKSGRDLKTRMIETLVNLNFNSVKYDCFHSQNQLVLENCQFVLMVVGVVVVCVCVGGGRLKGNVFCNVLVCN